MVVCKYLVCGHEDKYVKSVVVSKPTSCKKCGLDKEYKEKVIGSILVIDFVYIGRDGNKYYTCKCNKCQEKLLLTREEIVKYICIKGV